MTDHQIPSGLYLRTNAVPKVSHTFTKTAAHPTTGMSCLACGKPLDDGDESVLVVLGPGDDEDERAKARTGRFYTAVCAELHKACASGDAAP